jgi:hypothetical protein
MLLQSLPGTLEFACYGCVRLGYVLIERLVPAKVNQGRDDQNFSQ